MVRGSRTFPVLPNATREHDDNKTIALSPLPPSRESIPESCTLLLRHAPELYSRCVAEVIGPIDVKRIPSRSTQGWPLSPRSATRFLIVEEC